MARRINVPALGLALGIVWGVFVLLITWLNAITGGLEAPFGWYYPLVKGLVYCYPWYGPSFFGGIWGGILGLIDGIVFGAVVALIYNRFATPVHVGE